MPPQPGGPPIGGSDGGGYHYADAFAIRLSTPDDRSAETFARSALDNAPAPVRIAMVGAQRYLLRFRLGPTVDADHIQGWKIVRREPTVIQLEVTGPLGRAVVVGERPDPTTAVMTTYNFYRRPAVGRALWAVVGPMHRRIARYLLERAAAASA